LTQLPKPKEEGDRMNCPNCSSSIIARLKTYKNDQYPAYIQWQNANETKAHLDKDGNCSNSIQTESSTVTATGGSTTTIGYTTTTEAITLQKAPEFSDDTNSMIEGETLTLYMIRNRVETFLKKFEDAPHGGMVGQFTELIFNKHFQAKFQKASELD